MSDFDVVAHLKKASYAKEEVTEAPSTLTVEIEDGDTSHYYLDPIEDGSSLHWISLTMATFNEFIPGYHWCVDDPGTLYAQTDLDGKLLEDEGDEPIVSLERMQPVADELLKRYRLLVEHFRAEGRTIHSE